MGQAAAAEGRQSPSPRHAKKRRSSARLAKVPGGGGLSALAEVDEDEDSDAESSDDPVERAVNEGEEEADE